MAPSSEEMARRGRIAAAKGVLRSSCALAAAANRGNAERGARISASLKVALATPEARAARSMRARKQWTIPETRAKMIQGVIENMAKCGRDARVYFNTKPELAVKAKLDAAGIGYSQQEPLFGRLWDFAIHSKRMLIEVDGCYWHGCPKHHPDRAGITARRDAERDAAARSAGWKVYRIWEHDITANGAK